MDVRISSGLRCKAKREKNLNKRKQLLYPHKNLKLSNRIRKLQNKRRFMRHTSQDAIRPLVKVSFYPDSNKEKPNPCILKLHEDCLIRSCLKESDIDLKRTEDDNEDLYNAVESDEEQNEKPEKYIGEEAIFEYYDKFHKYSRDTQKCSRSPVINYIERLNKYKVPPSSSGLIKRSGSEKELNVKDYNLTKPYVSALSCSVKDLNIKNLTLSSINRNDEGVAEIFKNLSSGIEKLDCSNSSIGETSLLKLSGYIKESCTAGNFFLKVLNLSSNRITDENMQQFFDELRMIDNDIEDIDLSRNLLGDNSAKSLSLFLEQSYTIKTLNLSWNHIGPKGGISLFYGIYKGRTLRILDASYNCMGRGNSIELIEIIIEAINEEIWFDENKFGDLIEDNHTLFGLHLQGNACYVDGNGFIRLGETNQCIEYSKHSGIFTRKPNGRNSLFKFNPSKISKFINTTTCWTCEGWTENTFTLKDQISVQQLEEPVYIHFEFNNYQAELMDCINDETYSYTTMCPPGEIKYFFTLNKIAAYAHDHEKLVLKTPLKIKDITIFNETKTFKITRFNTRMILQGKVLDKK